MSDSAHSSTILPTHDALPQHEGVLRADGDDERAAQRRAVGKGDPVHDVPGEEDGENDTQAPSLRFPAE
jgi:hypothetical protein